MERSRRQKGLWLGVVLAFLLGAVLTHIAFLYEPYTFLIGDCPYYAQTAISLILDHDLDLRNQLKGGLEPHQKQVSLGARGEWYPKHPILLPLLTVPLVPIFKMKTFLIFNVIVLVALAAVLFDLCCLVVSGAAAAAGTLATIFGSFVIFYDYNYSPDLFACLLLSLAISALFKRRIAVSGLLAGFAVFARTSNLFLMPLLFAWAVWKGRFKGAALFAACAAAPLIAQAGLNAMMFGSPLVSPYARIITLDAGQIVLHSHMSDFGNPFWDGVRGQLFEPDKGLVRTAPVLFLAIPGWFIWFRRRPDQALLCFAVGEFLFLLFSRYDYWSTSHIGNRFLIPLVALSAPAVACALEFLIHRFSSGRLRTRGESEAMSGAPGGDRSRGRSTIEGVARGSPLRAPSSAGAGTRPGDRDGRRPGSFPAGGRPDRRGTGGPGTGKCRGDPRATPPFVGALGAEKWRGLS